MIQIYLVYIILIIWPFHWVEKRPISERWAVSSWHTNPWSNFRDPDWELICCNKWHPGTSKISTPMEIDVRTHFHKQHGTKTIQVFLPTDGEAYWSLFLSPVSLLPGSTGQPTNTFSGILKVTGQVWESQSYYLCIMYYLQCIFIGITFPNAHLNWFYFLILMGGLLIALIGCIMFL